MDELLEEVIEEKDILNAEKIEKQQEKWMIDEEYKRRLPEE